MAAKLQAVFVKVKNIDKYSSNLLYGHYDYLGEVLEI